MSGRLRNPKAGRDFAGFSNRFDACDTLLTTMIGTVPDGQK
jgi:hypothetical protein